MVVVVAQIAVASAGLGMLAGVAMANRPPVPVSDLFMRQLVSYKQVAKMFSSPGRIVRINSGGASLNSAEIIIVAAESEADLQPTNQPNHIIKSIDTSMRAPT
uniref:Uncharacterized protein n=1 Tax=Oryza brachyantha TaxID=4533 RepID=J3LX82_ORYBR